jgi:hypothetical protein
MRWPPARAGVRHGARGGRGHSAPPEKWAAGLEGPAYAIDDDPAIRVVDDAVDVVSEGNWKLFGS